MRYHLIKKSRVYNGKPYCGPASNNKPAEAETHLKALILKAELQLKNPVGWVIIDTKEKLNYYLH